jgi:Fe2+ or Zn2+ uptake regulation protein
MTKNGKLILDIINQSHNHLTIEQIFFIMKKKSPSVVLATVYNNVNALVEEGLIRRITMEGQPDVYDKMIRHDHLVCDCCGKLSDITLEDFSYKIEKEVGLPIRYYDLKIHYICDDCRTKLDDYSDK